MIWVVIAACLCFFALGVVWGLWLSPPRIGPKGGRTTKELRDDLRVVTLEGGAFLYLDISEASYLADLIENRRLRTERAGLRDLMSSPWGGQDQ